MLPKPKFSPPNQSPKFQDNKLGIKQPIYQNSHQNYKKFGNNNKKNQKRNFNVQSNNDDNKNKKNLIQCDYDGCRFQSSNQDEMIIHKKINHFQLCSKFNDGFLMDSPDEISKWREERRARFPKLSDNLPKPETKAISNDHQNDSNCNNNHNNPKSFHRHQQQYRGRSKQRINNRFSSNRFNNHNKNYRNNNNFRNQYYKKSPIKNVIQNEISNTINSNTNNSLNLLSCYGSECSDEETASNANNIEATASDDEKIITKLLDDLLIQVERKNQNRKRNSNMNDNNNNQSKKIRKHPYDPNQNINYSKLNLFQKLMLQDVRKMKDELIYSLTLIQQNNFLQS